MVKAAQIRQTDLFNSNQNRLASHPAGLFCRPEREADTTACVLLSEEKAPEVRAQQYTGRVPGGCGFDTTITTKTERRAAIFVELQKIDTDARTFLQSPQEF